MNRSGRQKRRLAFALALAVSGAHLMAFVGADAFATLPSSQTKTASRSKDRASQTGLPSEAKASTRSRGVEPVTEVVRYDSPDGPIIRIALMTDVTTVTLSCALGLMVNRGSSSFDDGKRVPGGSLRVELSQKSDSAPAAPIETSAAVYRVIVRYSYESRVARSLVEELKKKFFEPVTMNYDENQNEYAVLIGQCATRAEATKLAERLRKAGYEGPRVVSDSTPENVVASDSHTTANGPAAKSRSTPASSRAIHLVAFAADRVAATSADELIVVPAESNSTTNRIKQIAASSGDDDRSKRAREDQKGVSSQHPAIPQPAAVRVGGRDYRGEMHLVLNARGLINVVNVLPLEDYLRGVVLMEIPLGTPREIEALKAQAVAARSYALSHMGHRQERGYDLVNDARAQTYGGLTSERELTNLATDQTRGVVAVYPNEAGKPVPIEALYTANCGGRTENNEEVFGGKARGYLRSVACVPDRQQPLAGRDILTNRTPELLNGTEGRLIGREVATLSVLGFLLPRRVTNSYLQGAPDRDEVTSWTEQTARLARREQPGFTRGDATRLAEFARVISASVYGEGRASSLLDQADVDYLLAGVRVEQFPRDARADVAMLLRDGILHLHSGALDGHATITRGQAIETLARAVLFKSNADLKSQISNPRSQITDFRIETSAPAEKGRLFLVAPGSPSNVASRGQTPRFTSVNISGPAEMGDQAQDEQRESQSPRAAREIATPRGAEQDGSQRNPRANGIEIAEGAWLFRNVGGESYAVDRLTLIGGERVTYHLNSGGQADFLEASVSSRRASTDRLSTVGRWQERITVEELQQRLARAHINVGQVKTVEAVALSTSNRVRDLEVAGDQGHSVLRGRQIISAIGLKETLFVVAPEKDARGRVVAFVFTGRGWGHGVGMCQHGAYAMAKEGQSYTAILQKYYTGVKVQRVY